MKRLFICTVFLLCSTPVIADTFEFDLNYSLSQATISGNFGDSQTLGGVGTFFTDEAFFVGLGDTLIFNILFDQRLQVFEFFDPPGSTNQYFSFASSCGLLCPQPNGPFSGAWTSSIEALGGRGDIWIGAITKSWVGSNGIGWGGAGIPITESQGSFTGIRWTTTLTSVNEGGPVLLAGFTGVQMGADGILILPAAFPVTIDIKPGKTPNSINPNSGQKIPVAILTTGHFDALLVDPLTVQFGPDAATESHGRWHVKDVDEDGDMDLLFHFNTQETGIVCGDTEATLTGETFDGQAITGTDSIETVPCL
jgi:hypothetical protein